MLKSAHPLLALLFAMALLMAGCSGVDTPAPPELAGVEGRPTLTATPDDKPSATVSQEGFSLRLGAVTVQGPPGVAPAGTVATIIEIETQQDAAHAGVDLAVPAFDISLDGHQPEVPITVTVTFDEPVTPEHALAFITQPSGTDQWVGLPVTVDGRSASVTMNHLSIGVFSWFGDYVKDFTDSALKFMELTYDAPSCHGQELELDGHTYEASVDNEKLYVCVENRNDRPVLTVHSNSPFVWRVKADPATARGASPYTPASLSAGMTGSVAWLLLGMNYEKETVLVPGGSAPVTLLEGVDGTTAQARVDAGLGLVAVATSGLEMLVQLPGFEVPDLEAMAVIAECIVATGVMVNDPQLSTILRETLGCSTSIASGVASFILGGLMSVVPLLATQLMGLWGEIEGSNSATISVSRTSEGRYIRTGASPSFVTPSGNIVCSGIAGDVTASLQCNIAEYDFPAPEVAGCDKPRDIDLVSWFSETTVTWSCLGQREFYLNDAARPQEWETGERFMAPGGRSYAVLPYGATLKWEGMNIECSSEPSGLTCVDLLREVGFTLSSSEHEVFTP